MSSTKVPGILTDNACIKSSYLDREVLIDFFLPATALESGEISLLLINDGQDMEKMHLDAKLDKLYASGEIEPILFVAIHCGIDRKNEYGTQFFPDYKQRGAKAGLYTSFIFEELLPFIRKKYNDASFKEKAFAGFSLGALSALDIVWNRPGEFSKVGCFSASFWWRSLDQHDPEYDDDQHRIMHQQIRSGQYAPWLKFFFQCGNLDETKDRNHNGIIDSIDDTLDLIKELVEKGYDREKDIHYMEMEDGHHDVFTWGRAMPEFLRWGWGRKDVLVQNREF
ncbi:MAG TPA: alpha/beta hydrolase-fold protein [Chitinophagaceae bacterium]|nr:alpha/beta hydrolase-fold protein [Chitinophagaceae bacterium]